MALRGKKPDVTEKRLKLLLYGKSGVGKTYCSIHFPKPYYIDMEGSSNAQQYVDIINEKQGVRFANSDFNELIVEVKGLLTEKHDYKTVIIDPLSWAYSDLVEKAEKAIGKQTTGYAKHFDIANKQIKHLCNLLLRLDMNVIIIAHEKNEYGQNMAILGKTFDCYKKLDYLFDIALRVEIQGGERMAYVHKSRETAFPVNQFIPFSYEEIAKRYGKDILEKDNVPAILANEEEVNELIRLVDLLNVPEETIDKWLVKAKAATFDEMSKENITACISFLKSKISPEEP